MGLPMWDSPLHVQQVTLHPIAVRLVNPFVTSFGSQQLKAGVLVRAVLSSGAEGWGEVVANWDPGYSYETASTALHILKDFLVPRLMQAGELTIGGRWDWLQGVRGHPMAKHALLSALFSAYALEQNISMAEFVRRLAGAESYRTRVEVGVSIGIQPNIDSLLATIGGHLDEGYRRIKLKIKPGWDREILLEVRAAFPDAVIMADANSAYTLEDADLLRSLDEFNLLMIEQPLDYEDIYEHSLLQPELKTPICLDESLHTLGHVKLAHHLKACRIVNVKPQRIGGLPESVEIHNFCVENGLGLWVGGMLETGVGRATSLALAALPGFTLPADLSATRRYYDPDIADPPFDIDPSDSTLPVPNVPGLGVSVDMGRLAEAESLFYKTINEGLFH
jgi:o-succinylbenzoate synthase